MKMKFVKRVAVIIAAAALLTSAGCASNPTGGKSPSPASITAQLQKDIKFPEMLDETASYSRYYTGFSAGIVESDSLFICSSSASPAEIAVFKAKSSSDAATIEKSVKSRLSNRTSIFSGYGTPEENSELQNAVVETRGPYVILAVTADDAKARKTIDSFF
jgi:hypothetical protein